MKIRSWTMCLAAATVLSTAPSAAADTITFSQPFEGAVPNDCTEELFFAEGTMHVKETVNVTLDSAKTQLEMNLTGVKGTGLVSGARYVMNSQVSDMQHTGGDDAQSTFQQTLLMTRQGELGTFPLGGDDFQLHVIAHLTITNGVAKVTKSELRFDCR